MSSNCYDYFIKKNEECKSTNDSFNHLLGNLERNTSFIEKDLLDIQKNTTKCQSSRIIAGYEKLEDLGGAFNQTCESLQKVKDAMADKIYNKNK